MGKSILDLAIAVIKINGYKESVIIAGVIEIWERGMLAFLNR